MANGVYAVTRAESLLGGNPESRVANYRLDALNQRIPTAIGGDIDVTGLFANITAVRG